MQNRSVLWVTYGVALILSTCSLLYELLIAQTLATLAANTVVWYSVTIGVYLAALGVGALLHRNSSPLGLWERLFKIEILLTIVGSTAVFVMHFAHTATLTVDTTLVSASIFFGSALVMIILVGVLTGFELPLLINLGNEASPRRNVTNRVLGFDYLGALIAGIGFPLYLVPRFNLFTVGLLTASVNLVVALVTLCWILPDKKQFVARIAIPGLLFFVLIAGLFKTESFEQYFLKKYYYYLSYPTKSAFLLDSMSEREDVLRVRSPYQQIDIVSDTPRHKGDLLIDAYSTKFLENKKRPRDYALFLNGDFQVSAKYEEFYHEFFAHVPIALNGRVPARVLVLGGGDGLLIREILKHDLVQKIVHVDLDSSLIELATTHPILSVINEGSLVDPRVHTQIGDAFYFIQNTTEQFDAIFLDFPYANDYNLSKLYSREFFHFVKKRLTPSGFAALDAPGLRNQGRLFEIYLNTIKKAGFSDVRPYTSMVEVDNRSAREILSNSERWTGLSEKDKRHAIVGFIARHVHSLRNGFIMMADVKRDEKLYWDPSVNLHVLNEDRLDLTLRSAKRFGQTDLIDSKKVNSIFRPTLPLGSVWNIRAAWD